MAEKTIDGEHFSTQKINAIASFHLMTRLTKILGPGLTALDQLFDREKSDAAFGTALANIIKDIDPDKLTGIMDEVTRLAKIKVNDNYEPVVPTMHFTDLMTMFQVFVFVLEVNYKSFFDALKADSTFGRILAAAAASRQNSSAG